MSNFDWVYEFLQVPDAWIHTVKQGYYNTNYIVQHEGTKCVVRVPNPNAVVVDEMHFNESEVLRCLEELNFKAPRLFYEGKGFNVHQFIDGIVLEEAYTRPKSLPDWVPVEMARQMTRIHQLDINVDGKEQQPVITVESIKQHILDLYERFFDKPGNQLNELLSSSQDRLVSDSINCDQLYIKTVFAHCDIHRKNTIISRRNKLTLIDWELSKFVPLGYDLASHIHKSRYDPNQQRSFLNSYCYFSELDISSETLEASTKVFRDLEVIKSSIVDKARAIFYK